MSPIIEGIQTVVVSPAFRDYTSEASVKEAFLKGRDFYFYLHIEGKRLGSIRNLRPGVIVQIRYNRLRDVTSVTT